MELDAFQALLTPAGQGAISAAEALEPREVDFLTHFQALSKQYPPNLARAALETAILRREAASKFPEAVARRMYLTREALEQATSFEISTYRARRYEELLAPQLIVDLGCSIGGDTLALASVSATIGIDLDIRRISMARANLAAISELPGLHLTHPCDFVQADLREGLPLAARSSVGLFFDPARRSDHRRVFSTRDYQPALNVIMDWLPAFPGLGIKLSPGVTLSEIASYPAEVEFISLRGELKECVLWFGPLKQAERRATLLPGGAQLVSQSTDPTRELVPHISPPLDYLYEPDPAVLRAGLVRQLAEQIEAAQLDADIAYLTSQAAVSTSFARCWRVEAWFPFQLKKLRTFLRQNQVGKVTIKKRGSPLEPQALIRQLRLEGEAERVIFLTHLNGEPIVIICQVGKTKGAF